MSDIDPEGFYRDPDPLCVCGPLYTYGDHSDPGGCAEDCPIHDNYGPASDTTPPTGRTEPMDPHGWSTEHEVRPDDPRDRD